MKSLLTRALAVGVLLTFGFSPASADLDRQAHAAAELYARSPDAVRRMIVLSANAGINAFADAFRLRKD